MLKNNKDWKQQAIALADTGTMSWREIARVLGKSKSTVSDYLRAHYQALDDLCEDEEEVLEIVNDVLVEKAKTLFFKQVKEEDVKRNERILFISDLHAPYNHPDALDFLNDLKQKYKPTRIIGLGDETDYQALSYHDSDPDLMSAGDELKAAIRVIADLQKIFPEVDLVDSNHGSMVWRKAKTHGIPRHVIKSYKEVLATPNWNWYNDLILDLPDGQKVYVHHGKTKDALKLSRSMGMSTVTGHFHEDFHIRYWANPLGLYFAMQCGCLIDDDSYAFAYNNVNLHKPIIGTGLIIEGKPVLEAMKL